MDQAFLAEIEGWRDVLARNIALRNPTLDQRALNDAVQRTIDRIIFLRLCEDRGIEDYGQLQKIAGAADIYDALKNLFIQADYRYNSGLFHFESEKGRPNPDRVSLDIAMDDKALKPILRGLYYPDSPYEFSVMPADILGQVYEQFLGKVIRLTPSHQAKVEEKPEVRKAGGVYYTPTYIVDYIVANTIGKLLENKKPRDVDGSKKGAPPLRVLDPACGSGSFLIVAYQYLLDWFRDQYVAEGAEKQCRGANPKLRRTGEHDYALTIPERKRILLDHIHGVDIDPQAVEVTKLSLLLKVIEGENAESLGQNRQLFHERALPDLDKNIKCGNSLIGPDYFATQQEFSSVSSVSLWCNTDDLDTEEMFRINPFDWHAEFPEVFHHSAAERTEKKNESNTGISSAPSVPAVPLWCTPDGGFDIVIGNPPYVRQETLGPFKDYFAAAYRVYHGAADLYAYFIERGVSLLRPDGRFAYIVANKWMRANYGEPLRNWLAAQHIEEILDFGDLPVFKGATTYPCILRIRNAPPAETFRAATLDTLAFTNLHEHAAEKVFHIAVKHLSPDAWTLVDERARTLLEKIRNAGTPLGEYVNGKIYRGVLTGLNEAFVIDKDKRDELIAHDPNSAELIKPFLAGRDIKRYQIPTSERFLIFTRRGVNINDYPAIKEHLAQYKQRLTPKPPGWKGDKWPGRKPGPYKWYEIQDTVEYYPEFEKPKIMYAEIASRGQFALDYENYYVDTTAFIMDSDDHYLLGVLNSGLFTFLFASISSQIRGGFYRWKRQYMNPIPILLEIAEPSNKKKHDQISALVKRLLTLNQQLAIATNTHERTLLERQITATDRQIDQLVYALYGLTEEEVALVEREG